MIGNIVFALVLSFLGTAMGLSLVFGPFIAAGYMLRKLDVAARRNRYRKVRIVLPDIFSLLFLVQLPLSLVLRFIDDINARAVAAVILCLAMMLVWWTAIKSVDRAGITDVGWRWGVSLVAIPVAFIGSYAMMANGLQLMAVAKSGYRNEMVVAAMLEVVLFVAMVGSFYLVNRAIANAK